MPTPYIELPSVDELFNRQQDNTTLLPDEDLDSSHEFNLQDEFTGKEGIGIYSIQGGLYENLTANNTPVLVTGYGKTILIFIYINAFLLKSPLLRLMVFHKKHSYFYLAIFLLVRNANHWVLI